MEKREPEYGPVEPETSHVITEVSVVIMGPARRIKRGGKEVPMVETVRIVLPPEGPPVAVVGGMGQPVTAYEAGKIGGQAAKEVKKGLRRAGRERKKKLEVIEGEIKKGGEN